jgi:hypothetical protein
VDILLGSCKKVWPMKIAHKKLQMFILRGQITPRKQLE